MYNIIITKQQIVSYEKFIKQKLIVNDCMIYRYKFVCLKPATFSRLIFNFVISIIIINISHAYYIKLIALGTNFDNNVIIFIPYIKSFVPF